MLDLLVKKNEYNQIVVLGSALSNKKKTVPDIQEQLTISKSSFNRYLNNLNHDLTLFFDEKLELVSDGYHLTLVNPTNQSNHNVFMATLKFYINQSTTFKILLMLSYQNPLEVETILNELHISYSYLNKLIKEINQYMWRTSVSLTQRQKMLSLEGPELNVVVFIIGLKLALWRFDPTHDVLLEVTKGDYYYESTHLSHLNTLQTNRLAYVAQTILDQPLSGSKIDITDSEVNELLLILTSYKNVIKAEGHPYSDTELLFLNLLTRILCPKIDSLDDRIALAKLFLKVSNSITKDALNLLDFIRTELFPKIQLDSDDYYHYVYQSIMSFLYLRLLDYNFTDLFTLQTDRVHGFYISDQPELNKIKQNLSLRIPFVSDKNKLIFVQNHSLFTSGIYTALRETKATTLNLFIDFKYQISFELYLKKRLEQLFSKDIICYLDNINHADIIITDFFIETPKDKSGFIFVDTNSITAMEDLMVKLTKIYTQKLQKAREPL